MAQEETSGSNSPQPARRLAAGIGMIGVVMIVCSFFLPFETGMYTFITTVGDCPTASICLPSEEGPFTSVLYGMQGLWHPALVLLIVLLFFFVILFPFYVFKFDKRPGCLTLVSIGLGLLFLTLYLWLLSIRAYRGEYGDYGEYHDLIAVSVTPEIGWYVTIGGSILLGLSLLGVGSEEIVFRLKQRRPAEKVGVTIIVRAICRAIFISATVGLLLGVGWWLLFWTPERTTCELNPNLGIDPGPYAYRNTYICGTYPANHPGNPLIVGLVTFTIVMVISVVHILQGKMPFDDRRLSDLKRESPT